MKLYNFSIFAKRRDERNATRAVAEVAGQINNPGAVIELKARVNDWYELHRQILESRRVG